MVLLQTLYRTTSVAAFVAGGDPSAVINWDFLQSQSLTSFSRTSNATMFDSTGKLTYAPNNLVTYSQQFDNAAWNKTTAGSSNGTITPDATTAPDGSATADLYTPNTSNIIHAVWKSVTVQVGVKSIYSFYVKANGYNWVSLETYDGGLINTWFDITPGTSGSVGTVGSGCTATITPVGNDWFRCSVTRTPGNASSYFEVYCCNGNNVTAFAANGTSGIYVWGAQLEAVTYQTTPSTYNATTSTAYYGPRYPYAYNGSTWDAQGLLVEAAGTNYLPYSNTFSSWSNLNSSTITSSAATSPDGTSNGWSITDATAANLNVFQKINTSVTGTSVVFSAHLKQYGTNTVDLYIYKGSTGFARQITVTLTGSGSHVDVVGSGGVTISNVGGGWYRVSVSASGLTSSWDYTYGIYNSNGVYVYGAQVEAGDLSSYIPNLATGTTTRNAEIIQITGTALTTMQGSAGTLVIDQQGCTGYLLAASAANNAPLYYGSSTTAKTNNNSNQSLTATFGSSTFASATKIGVAWDGSGRSLCAVNGTVATDANAFATLTNAYIGSDGSANFANGYIRSIKIWNTRLSDTSLKAKTV